MYRADLSCGRIVRHGRASPRKIPTGRLERILRPYRQPLKRQAHSDERAHRLQKALLGSPGQGSGFLSPQLLRESSEGKPCSIEIGKSSLLHEDTEDTAIRGILEKNFYTKPCRPRGGRFC